MSAEATVLLIAALLVGLCIGSFTNVVIDRLPLKLDEPNDFGEIYVTNPWRYVLGGSSRCSSCGEPIHAYDNVPLLSWFILGGRCRRCRDRIPAFHPFVEALVPAIGVLVWWGLGSTWRLAPALWLVPVGIAIMVIDSRTYIVPTRLVWPALLVSVVLSGVGAAVDSQPQWLLGGLVGVGVLAGPLLLLWIVMPAGMGFGDVRLAVLLGWTVGFVMADHRPVSSVFAALICLVVAATLGLVFGLIVIGARGMRAKVPFGPTLVIAALLVCGLAPHLRHAFNV